MSNVSIKKLIIPVTVGACMAMVVNSCGESEEHKRAAAMIAEARTMIAEGNPAGALAALDSLDAAYPALTDLRREAIALRPKAVEAITIAEIQSTDSLLAQLQLRNEATAPLMKQISSPELLEPYYVAKEGYNPDFVNSNGVQARVDMVGQYTLLSSAKSGSPKHIAVEFTSGADRISTPHVMPDGETNFRMDGSELITYEPGGTDSIGIFFQNHRNDPVKGFFISENGRKIPFTITPAQVRGMADAYLYSTSITEAREATVTREKLERKLQLSRDQAARTATESK